MYYLRRSKCSLQSLTSELSSQIPGACTYFISAEGNNNKKSDTSIFWAQFEVSKEVFCSWLVFNVQAADDIYVGKLEGGDAFPWECSGMEVVGAECSVCDHFRLWGFCCSSWCSGHQQPWLGIFMFSVLYPFLITVKARKTKELMPSAFQHVTTPGSVVWLWKGGRISIFGGYFHNLLQAFTHFPIKQAACGNRLSYISKNSP